MGFIISRTDNSLPGLNRKRLAIYSVIGITFAVLAIILALIDVVSIIARYNTRLSIGSPIHKLLQAELDGVHVETYLFNVTNSDRFLSGQDKKLKVEEVGPFTYKETRTHRDLELDEASGVLRYTPITNVTFVPEESIADPRDVNVTMPNIAYMTMTSMLSSYTAWTQIPFNLLVRRLGSKPIVTMDAHNYLWGYDEPLITFGNTVLPGWINFDTMGVMDRLYDKKSSYRLELGATNADKFKIISMDGLNGMKALNYDNPSQRSRCNTFINAFEGIAYPPGMKPGTDIRIWRNVLCRFLELDYVETRHMSYGANALVYKISNRTYNNNPDKECLCKKGTCYNGVSDLSPCFLGLPLAISNAHFLDGEPKLFRRVEGLNPDEKEHGSQFLIDPVVGLALGTRFTVQVNVVMEDVSFNSDASPFSDMIIPISYFRIVQPKLNEKQVNDVRAIWVYGPNIMLGIEIALFILGMSMLVYVARQVFVNIFYGESRTMSFSSNEDEKKADIKACELPLMTDASS